MKARDVGEAVSILVRLLLSAIVAIIGFVAVLFGVGIMVLIALVPIFIILYYLGHG